MDTREKKPKSITLSPGRYYWCKCGKSDTQPLCDGSLKGFDFRPVPIIVEEEETLLLCMCKKTKDEPFCDGTHLEIE